MEALGALIAAFALTLGFSVYGAYKWGGAAKDAQWVALAEAVETQRKADEANRDAVGDADDRWDSVPEATD